LLVAACRTLAHSTISAMKLDSPRIMESEEPTRVNTPSNTGSVADVAGTKLPI
jgi:hypothetical protein